MSSRKTTNVFIALFLLAQIVVPLRYYLGSRSADERFSWRMFSSYGMQHAKHDALTQVSVRETALENGRLVERSVDLPTILPKRWIQYLRHEQPDVTEKFLRWRGSQSNAQEVRCQVSRPAGRGEPRYRVVWTIDLPSGELRVTEDP